MHRPSNAIPGYVPASSLCSGAYLEGLDYSYTVGEKAIDRFDRIKAKGFAPVHELGAEAYWDRGTRTLHAGTPQGYFYIVIPDLEKPRGVAVALSKKALARIESEESGHEPDISSTG